MFKRVLGILLLIIVFIGPGIIILIINDTKAFIEYVISIVIAIFLAIITLTALYFLTVKE